MINRWLTLIYIYIPLAPNPTGYFEANLRYHFIYLNQSICACDPFLSYVNINYHSDSHLLSTLCRVLLCIHIIANPHNNAAN